MLIEAIVRYIEKVAAISRPEPIPVQIETARDRQDFSRRHHLK